jgi:hypothetical protein
MYDNMSIQRRRRKVQPDDIDNVMETIMNKVMKGGGAVEDNADILPCVYDDDECLGERYDGI